MTSELTDLDELRELTAAATPGPWEMDLDGALQGRRKGMASDSEMDPIVGVLDRDADNAFIAAARTAVPELLDRVQAAEAKLAAVEALHQPTHYAWMSGMVCDSCLGSDEEPVTWPCPTAAALGLPVGGETGE